MKLIIFTARFLVSVLWSQVGIRTTDPSANLEIETNIGDIKELIEQLESIVEKINNFELKLIPKP